MSENARPAEVWLQPDGRPHQRGEWTWCWHEIGDETDEIEDVGPYTYTGPGSPYVAVGREDLRRSLYPDHFTIEQVLSARIRLDEALGRDQATDDETPEA